MHISEYLDQYWCRYKSPAIQFWCSYGLTIAIARLALKPALTVDLAFGFSWCVGATKNTVDCVNVDLTKALVCC